MTEINRAGEPGSLGEVNTTQREFREQIDALNDIVRQIGGNPDVNPGDTFPSDPLSAPYVLYVDSYTGKDTFVGGDYNSKDDGTFADKVKRISLQRLECGYTINRPFRTINRAIIEAAIITSRDFLTLKPGVCGDLVSIVVAAGVHEIINGSGSEIVNVGEWVDGQVPTDAELQAFNPQLDGGLILPRGCSVVSLDLRKAILRPQFVPEPAPEFPDYSNRRAIFKVTGGGYYFGFTFLDKLGFNRSHHLLDAFQYASESELDDFYAKILRCFGASATGIDPENAKTRLSEYQITGEVGDLPTNFTEESGGTDTVRSASPYIYNTSLRSTYGMCGIFADGDKVEGFKSMVVAQFTGVSLQNDFERWQKYTPVDNGSWIPVISFNDYIGLDPDDLRQDPTQRSFHVRAVNEALIQEVSVFAIGQAIHHWAQSGAQLTITNSNSNFGGCSALADGFQKKAARTDGPWTLKFFRTALNPLSKRGNINRIILGTLEENVANNAKTLELTSELGESTSNPGQPDILARDGYSLKQDDYLWIENPGGDDYRARLAKDPWDPSVANILRVKDTFTTDINSGQVAPGGNLENINAFPDIAGKRVYVRRLVDVRTVEERRYSLLLKSENPGSVLRLPLRDYVIAPLGIDNGYGELVQAVAASENVLMNPAVDVKVELRYSNKPTNPVNERQYNENVFYRKGDVVLNFGKHFTAIRNTTGEFDPADFDESYVHMQDDFIPEGFFKNAQPLLIFDKDVDEAEDSIDLGNEISDINPQIESAVDYLAIKYFARNLKINPNLVLGFAETEEERDIDASGILGFEPRQLEFRRPTNCRLFGQAYEWTGFGNYSKALPQYQGELSPSNKFTYYFTNEDGGKVFATGFNEEGLQVTPRGLEDITTGEVLSVVDIGNPDRDISIPTDFESIVISESLTLPGGAGPITGPAKVGQYGPVKLASFTTTDVLVIAGGDTQEEREGSINTNAANDGVVTPAWLNKWRIDNNILSAPDVRVNVYVDPINGMDMSVAALSSNPPNRPSQAVRTLAKAVEYANTVFGPEAVVIYNLGPGPYLETETRADDSITFKTIAEIRAYDFTRNEALNNANNGGTKPFLQNSDGSSNATLFDNVRNQPTFLTRVGLNRIQNTPIVSLRVRPLKLIFEQPAFVTGVAWYGPAQTLKAWASGQLRLPENPGDSDENDVRADAYFADFYTSDVDDVTGFVNKLKADTNSVITPSDDSETLNVLVSNCFDSFNFPESIKNVRNLNRTGNPTPLVFNDEGNVRNVAFGAFIPISEGEGADGSRGVIETRGETLVARGIYLIGNVKLSSEEGNARFIFRDEAAFNIRGFHESFILTDSRNRPEDSVNIKFGGSDTDDNFNLPWNNIHLVSNRRREEAADNVGTDFNARGPVLGCLINTPGQLVLPTGIWTNKTDTPPGNFQGFIGAFGTIRSSTDASIEGKTRGVFGYELNVEIKSAPPGFKATVSNAAQDLTSFWRVAGTGQFPGVSGVPDDSGLDFSDFNDKTPGSITPKASIFDPLNVSITLYKKGVDINEGYSITQNLRL